LWISTGYLDVLPPPIKKQLGRPKKARNKALEEITKDGATINRKRTVIKCRNCGKARHNRVTCKVSPPPLTKPAT